MPSDTHKKMSKMISERQISRLYVVGSNDITAPVIEDSYRRFLGIMDELIQRQPFLLGERPSAADLAFYAQLTQLAKFDPTPAKLCMQEAPRVHAWTDIVDDLSGCAVEEGSGWLDRDQLATSLIALLGEVGRTYVPALIANAAALQAGETEMNTEIDGKPWTQPTFPYQGKCLQWIREEFNALSADDQQVVRGILDGTGCEPLLA
jgi:hypothetical protein